MSTDSLPRTSYRLLVGIALGAMLAGSAALAQDPVPDTLFVERLDVDVINVEVFVTDRDGRRVADLAPDDFELLVDGQPAEISNFYVAYREDKVLDAAERGAPIQLTPEERPDEQRLHLMVYVDHYNMAPGNRKRVLDSLANFLEDRVGQGDRVMLAGFDGNFEVAQTFTDDLGVLLQGIDKLGEYATHRQVVDAERRWAQKAIAGAALEIPPDATSAHGHLRTFVQSVEAGVRRSAGALRGAVRSLGGLPGRKAVLYVGEGLARRPGEELYQHMLDIFGQAGLRQLTDAGVTSDPTVEMIGRDQGHLFQQVIQDANAHQVTLYSIDARGPSGSSSLSAAAPSMSGGPSGSTLVDATRTHSQQETLIQMATATGGATALGTFAFGGALDRMARDFDTYYSLGYR
ncbi:MAG: VWA domain-containing protein, partial [Acidobacteriota bacterium]